MFSYVGTDKTGGIFDNAFSELYTSQTGNQLTINAATFNNSNFTISAGQYIAKINLTLLKSGQGVVSFPTLNFRFFDGLGARHQLLQQDTMEE